MQLNNYRTLLWLAFLTPVLLSGFLAWYSLHLNDYAITPDASGLACAIDHFATTGQLLTQQVFSVGFEACWTGTKYTLSQLFHGALLWLLPVSSWNLVIATGVLAYVASVGLMSLLLWRLTRSPLAVVMAGVFTAACPALLRSLILTPQNLFGYLLIIGGMLVAWRMIHTQQNNAQQNHAQLGHARWWWMVLGIGLLVALAFTHDLSFAIGGISFVLWFVIVYAQRWWSRLLPLVLIAILFLIDYWADIWLPLSPLNMLNVFLHTDSAGFDHAIWDHPAMWGYVITAMATIGLAAQFWATTGNTTAAATATTTTTTTKAVNQTQIPSYKLPGKFIGLLIIIIIVTLILGHVTPLGIGLLPNRFIPFAWLGLVPLAAVGVTALYQRCLYQRLISQPASSTVSQPASQSISSPASPTAVWTRIILIIVISLLSVAQIAHGIVFMQDDINGWSARYRPKPGYIEALQWLNEYDATGDTTGSVLGVQGAIYQEMIMANVWYHGTVYFYPWYSLNHRDLFDFSVLSGSSPLRTMITQPDSAQYQQLHDFFLIVTQPTSAEGVAAIATRDVDYLMTWRRSMEYTKVWQDVPAKTYPIIYENESYVIYDLQPNDLQP